MIQWGPSEIAGTCPHGRSGAAHWLLTWHKQESLKFFQLLFALAAARRSLHSGSEMSINLVTSTRSLLSSPVWACTGTGFL